MHNLICIGIVLICPGYSPLFLFENSCVLSLVLQVFVAMLSANRAVIRSATRGALFALRNAAAMRGAEPTRAWIHSSPAYFADKPVSSTSFDKMKEDARYQASNDVPESLLNTSNISGKNSIA